MRILEIQITAPEYLNFENNIPPGLRNKFFLPLYRFLYGKLNEYTQVYPHIDFDTVRNEISGYITQLSHDESKELRRMGCGNGAIESSEWTKSLESRAMMIFLWQFPFFANLLNNIHLLAHILIKSVEFHLQSEITTANFIEAKKFIDYINRDRWTRPQTNKEQQSGVSNLGSISEMLLERALVNLIDDNNFFKTTNPKIQSYGDFVLMSLPNNLWISVKSNFARERLLASGYTTDILGVGFFTSKDEFISRAKIRNFQRVGFLAMYLPDIPISKEQVEQNTNTYDEVMTHYKISDRQAPLNINGTDFIRPLSQLNSDLSRLLAIKDIANRTTIDY